MKTSDKIKVEMSQTREKLAVLSEKSDATDEEKAERSALTAGYPDLEARYQAAMVSEDEETQKAVEEDPHGELDAESREFHEKIAPETNLSGFFTAVHDGVSLTGAHKEYCEALEVSYSIKQSGEGIGLEFPLYLLDPGAVEGDKAQYAATTLTLDLIRRGNGWLNRVFLNSASTALGVTRKSVPKGQSTFATITAGATAATTAPGTAKVEETLTARSLELEPRGIRAGYQVSSRDLYRLAEAYETALVADLRGLLVENMDKEIINGVGSEISGFLSDTSISKRQIDGTTDGSLSAASTVQQFVNAAVGFVDGRYASDTKQISFICPPEVYRWLWASVLNVGTTAAVYSAPWLRETAGIMFLSSDQISAITGNQYYVIFCKQVGKENAAIHATWNSGMILRDPYGTNKTQGFESFYIMAHHDFGLLRHENWAVRRVRTA